MLLISAVAMTIGLSVSKRTTVETKIDTDEEQLKQAFNAAESGLDYYLKTNNTSYSSTDNSSSASIGVTSVGVGATVGYGQLTLGNHTANFWLVAHDASGNINLTSYYTGGSLNICVDNVFLQALKIDFFYVNGGNYYVWRQGYNVGNNTTVNNFVRVDPGNDSCGSGRKLIPVGNIPLGGGNVPLLLAVRPIGTSTRLAITGSGSLFPSQGEEITSTGRIGSGVLQKVKIYNQYRIPSFMIDGVTANNVLSN